MKIAVRALTASLVLALAGCSDAPTSTNDAALRELYAQTLDWRGCGDGRPADAACATLQVPRDYADAAGVRWTIAVARLRATDEGARLGTIVINPGGPGISGVADLLGSGGFYDRLRARYDLVSFDPRGVGASVPSLQCIAPPLASAISDQVSHPTTPEQQALAFELAREVAVGCERQLPEVLPHVGTRDVARDMDLLRAALGEEQLDYLGFSYGTYLGAVYAGLFPDRTDRVVLDSAMNPANAYVDLRHDQALAFQASIERFAADCPLHDDCPLAPSLDAALEQIDGVITALDREAYVGSDGRVLSGSRAEHLIESAMYFPEGGWPDLRAVLGPALAGDYQPMLDAAYGSGMYVNPADGPYLAVMCHDLQVGRDPSVIPATAAEWAVEASITGANRAWSVLPCTEWRAQSPFLPAPIEAAGSGDILVIGITHDPATPVQWARALAASLAHGRLLEWQGDGHIAYGRGGACVDDAIEGFFLDGVLPPDGAVCPH